MVGKLCFKCGLYRQGLAHDWSKYSPTEFWSGVKFFQGNRSPIDAEKEKMGYSNAWLHHKGMNKHHWEYWIDKTGILRVIDMPTPYLIETILDRIAAAKVYHKDYNDAIAYNYFKSGTDQDYMNPNTAKKIFYLLEYLKENGEIKALNYYKYLYKEYKNGNDILNRHE